MQRRLGKAWLALAVFAMLVPAASADDGSITARSPVLFQGPAELAAGEGLARFTSGTPGAPVTLDLEAEEAVVRHTRAEFACPSVGLAPCFPTGRETHDRYEIEELVLRGTSSQVSRLTLQWEAAEDAQVWASLDGVTELLVDDGAAHGPCTPATCRWSALARGFADEWYVANDAWDLAGEGRFRLILLGLNVQVGGLVDGQPFQAAYETGEREEEQAAYTVQTVEFLEIDAKQAEIELVAATPGRVYGDVAVAARGTTTFYGARGTFEAGDRAYELRDEDATVPGNLTVVPVAVVEERGDPFLVVRVAGAGAPLAPASTDAPFDAAATGAAVGIGGAALAVFTLAWFWPYLKYVSTALMVVPMYSRIGREDVLEHGKREQIFALIRDVPGIHAHEISSRAEVGWGTTVYHLKLLEDHGLIVGKRTGRYKRFFATAGGAARNVDHYAVLRNATTAAIARHVLAHPGCIQKDVCGALGLAPSLVTWHMNRLEEVDLVKKVREGRTVRYFAGGSWGGLRMDFAPETVTPTLVDAGAN